MSAMSAPAPAVLPPAARTPAPCPFDALPPDVLDRILRATGLSLSLAHRVLPRVCRAWRAAVRRVSAGPRPWPLPLAVACAGARALLLLDVAAPCGGARERTAPLLARYDIHAVPGDRFGAWPTYVAREGGPVSDDGAASLVMCEYSRKGVMLLDVSLAAGAERITCRGCVSDPKLEFPEGVACAPGGRVYVAAIGSDADGCRVCLLQSPPAVEPSCSAGSAARAPRTLRPTHAPDNTPLELGKKRATAVRQEADMPKYSELTSPAAWAVARYAGSGSDALYVALHANTSPGDGDDDTAELDPGAPPAYLRPTATPTGGVWRMPLDGGSGRFRGRSAWAVAPQAGLLNRPSALAFSPDGAVAYVATFLPAPPEHADADVAGLAAAPPPPARGVRALGGPAAAPAQRWAPLRGWDACAAPDAGVYPWALAVHPRDGALFAAAHGGAAGHCVAQLCPSSGAVLRIWRHPQLDGSVPNSLTLL